MRHAAALKIDLRHAPVLSGQKAELAPRATSTRTSEFCADQIIGTNALLFFAHSTPLTARFLGAVMKSELDPIFQPDKTTGFPVRQRKLKQKRVAIRRIKEKRAKFS